MCRVDTLEGGDVLSQRLSHRLIEREREIFRDSDEDVCCVLCCCLVYDA